MIIENKWYSVAMISVKKISKLLLLMKDDQIRSIFNFFIAILSTLNIKAI